jgi:predicted RNA binding protein YcfA (HicA-like mRNA interferase family)
VNPERLLKRLQTGSFNNVRFSDLVRLVEALGFELRGQRGSHRIYRHRTYQEKLNLQPLRNGDAKPYQLRQLMSLVGQYALTVEDADD